MTFDDYLELRKKEKRLTWGDVTYLLERDGYCHRFVYTFVPVGQSCWSRKPNKGKSPQEKIFACHHDKIPGHFAYIKFYKTARGEGPFALVAGKTNLGNPDFDFRLHLVESDGKSLEEMSKDWAKHFLLRTEGSWYCQGVLAVWKTDQKLWSRPEDIDQRKQGPQYERAKEVEGEVQKLLGLFSS